MPPINVKPIKMFIYQPVYLAGEVKGLKGTKEKPVPPPKPEYKKTTIVRFPFCRIEVGDSFTGEKRPADYFKLQEQAESKVAAVRYNLPEKACIVFLEDKVLKSEEEINRFVSGKGVV